MKYLRIYAGPDGESHFEDVEVDLSAGGEASAHGNQSIAAVCRGRLRWSS